MRRVTSLIGVCASWAIRIDASILGGISFHCIWWSIRLQSGRGGGLGTLQRLKFNGNAITEFPISGPTGLARASDGALALLMIKVVACPAGWGALAWLRVKLFVGNGRAVSYLMGDECACE
jgi:hypothetical protein